MQPEDLIEKSSNARPHNISNERNIQLPLHPNICNNEVHIRVNVREYRNIIP